MQLESPALENVPTPHETQLDAPPDEYLPALQLRHPEAPAVENVPATHSTQMAEPVRAWWRPPRQSTHEVEPVVLACVPLEHARHDEVPVDDEK